MSIRSDRPRAETPLRPALRDPTADRALAMVAKAEARGEYRAVAAHEPMPADWEAPESVAEYVERKAATRTRITSLRDLRDTEAALRIPDPTRMRQLGLGIVSLNNEQFRLSQWARAHAAAHPAGDGARSVQPNTPPTEENRRRYMQVITNGGAAMLLCDLYGALYERLGGEVPTDAERRLLGDVRRYLKAEHGVDPMTGVRLRGEA